MEGGTEQHLQKTLHSCLKASIILYFSFFRFISTSLRCDRQSLVSAALSHSIPGTLTWSPALLSSSLKTELNIFQLKVK